LSLFLNPPLIGHSTTSCFSLTMFTSQENSERYRLIAITFFVLLLIFGLTTPFDFSWPDTVMQGKNIFSVTVAVARMEHGNMGRRVGLLLLGIYTIFTLSRTENRYRFHVPSGLILAFYLFWIQCSLVWSVDTLFTLRRVITVDILWAAAIATAARYKLRELAWLTVFITASTFFLGFANELRLHTFNPTNEMWRFSGLFHTVAMGWNLSILALSSMFLITGEKHGGCRFALIILMLLSIIFLALTKSRMPVVATLFSMVFYYYRVLSRSQKIIMILAPIIILSIAFFSLGDQLIRYGDAAATLGRGESARESVSNLTGRIPLWKECLKWAEKRPVVGYGFNTFINPGTIDEIFRNVGWMPVATHSGYVDALMGLGFVGAATLIFFLLTAFIRAWSLSRQYPEYIFIVSMLLWLYYNLFMGAGLITRPTFMTFFSMTLLARLAFLPGSK